MSDAVSGGCLCGRIRYEYAGEIGPASYCHCADCRRVTGSAFHIGIKLDESRFRILRGAPKPFTKLSDGGDPLTRHFCPNCGSPLFTSAPRHPGVVFIKAGSLDDPSVVKPAQQAWTRSAVPWARIDDDLPTFATDAS